MTLKYHDMADTNPIKASHGPSWHMSF